MTPDEIARAMTGRVAMAGGGRHEALLPSPMIQNHASFLHLAADGALICAWFGGTLEGKSDISIFASVLPNGADQWGAPQRLSFDPDHSEQNPVLFAAPGGTLLLFHTSQPSGNQDECRIRMATVSRDASDPTRLTADEGGISTCRAAALSAHRSRCATMAPGFYRFFAASSGWGRNGTAAMIAQRSAFRATRDGPGSWTISISPPAAST